MKPKNKLLTVANFITATGIIAVGVACYHLINQSWWPWFFISFTWVGLSDLLDGYIARKTDEISDLGEFLDPARDKLAILVLICISWPMTLIVILLELISIYYSKKARKISCYHIITNTSKVMTTCQFIIINLIGLGYLLGWSALTIQMMFVTIYVTSICRALSYYRYCQTSAI